MEIYKTTMHRLAFCLLVACGLWSAAAHAQPYTITFLAGQAGPYSGYTDGVGSQAKFWSPGGLALDSAGNVYVPDAYTVRKVTPGGVVSTLAGKHLSPGYVDGAASEARFSEIYNVAVDSRGNVYVTEMEHAVRKITPEGMVSTLAGLAGSDGYVDGVGSAARFSLLMGIAVDKAGTVYVTDLGNYAIRKITPEGVVGTLAGCGFYNGHIDGFSTNASFVQLHCLAIDPAGNLYATDGSTIRKITPEGVVSTLAGQANSYVYVDGVGSAARFKAPTGIAADSAGNVYVSDLFALRKITTNGVVSTLAGGPTAGYADGTGSDARFHYSGGLAVDSAGNIYISDYHTIRLGFPPPSLSCHTAASQLVLSWPLVANNYDLETSSSVSPDAIWTPVSSPVAIWANRFVVTNTMDFGPRFYRLRKTLTESSLR